MARLRSGLLGVRSEKYLLYMDYDWDLDFALSVNWNISFICLIFIDHDWDLYFSLVLSEIYLLYAWTLGLRFRSGFPSSVYILDILVFFYELRFYINLATEGVINVSLNNCHFRTFNWFTHTCKFYVFCTIPDWMWFLCKDPVNVWSVLCLCSWMINWSVMYGVFHPCVNFCATW